MPDLPHARRARTPRGQGDRLRGEVLQAAMDLLTETGDEEAMSIRAVAHRVGVSVPSIYLHFVDKQALLDAVCDAVFAALHARMRAASQDAPHPFERLRRQGNAYVAFALDNPEHYRIVFMRGQVAARPDAVDQVIATTAFGHLLEAVQECLDAGLFVGEPVELGLRLWAAAHGVAALLIAKPYFPWPPREELVDRTIRMAGLGLIVEARTGLDCETATMADWLALAATVEQGRPRQDS